MVTALALLGVLAVLFAAGVLATREGGELAPAPPDAPDLVLPTGPIAPEDLAAVRFPLAARGYRMAEVDAVLARLGEELRDRDRRIALLEAAAAGHEEPVAGSAPDDAPPVRTATVEDLPVPPPASGPAGAAPSTARDWSA